MRSSACSLPHRSLSPFLQPQSRRRAPNLPSLWVVTLRTLYGRSLQRPLWQVASIRATAATPDICSRLMQQPPTSTLPQHSCRRCNHPLPLSSTHHTVTTHTTHKGGVFSQRSYASVADMAAAAGADRALRELAAAVAAAATSPHTLSPRHTVSSRQTASTRSAASARDTDVLHTSQARATAHAAEMDRYMSVGHTDTGPSDRTFADLAFGNQRRSDASVGTSSTGSVGRRRNSHSPRSTGMQFSEFQELVFGGPFPVSDIKLFLGAAMFRV